MNDAGGQSLIGQGDFSGGLNMLSPGPNQFKDGLNLVIRDGQPATRPGIRQYLAVDGGFLSGFWFNQEAWKLNDAGHTGFWFPFDFVRSPWGTIQGCALIRLSIHTENKILFAVGGAVFIYEKGYVEEISCDPAPASTETLEFVQANDQVFMFRGAGNTPLYWNPSVADGFVEVPDSTIDDSIPEADTAIYHQGRLWVPDGDDVHASAVLAFGDYDRVKRMWSIERQATDEGVILYPFHENSVLCFKPNSVAALVGINAPVVTGTFLADYVSLVNVDNHVGAIARHGIVTVGEDVWYLGYGGIYSVARNQQNRMELSPVAVSAPIQPLIDRINWQAAQCACAVFYGNYVLYAVPVDGATQNNMVLVFDKLANNGAGAWCGPWTSDVLNPVRFFKDNERLIFLGADNKVRVMFTGDAWDSESPHSDTPAWDSEVIYQGGERVYFEYNGDQIYTALQTSQNVEPSSDAAIWQRETELWDVYNIHSMLETRQFTVNPAEGAIRFSRAEVAFAHQDPQVTLTQVSRDHETETVLFTEKEYDQRDYDIADKGPWDETNADLDFNDPHRQDYTLFVPEDGIYLGSDGIWAGIWENHNLRWLPLLVNMNSLGIRIENTRGKLKLRKVAFLMMQRRAHAFVMT